VPNGRFAIVRGKGETVIKAFPVARRGSPTLLLVWPDGEIRLP
jgi:hypothetical protein